ncbi:MAG: TerB family tellurite resistance protein [Candidatus Ornithospirochaeta sp.]
MTEFDDLCREAEDIDFETRCAILKGKSQEILPLLSEKSEDGESGADILSTFLFSAMAADGRLCREEYDLLHPLLSSFLGEKINYTDAKKAVGAMRKENREMKKISEDMVGVLAEFSEDLRREIVLVIMMICAADGKISLSEKQWIKKLLF